MKRNAREDWKRTFGEDISEIDAVAIMTDTDNSGLSAKAWYGEIGFQRSEGEGGVPPAGFQA